jgi:acyl-CoA thioesterase-1
VSVADYEKNLRELVSRLRTLSPKLIWCTTTPVPGTDLNPPRRNEDVIAYNAVARRVMQENGVFIDDLYSFVLPQADRIRKPLDVHYTLKGYNALAQQVAKCIEQVLNVPDPSQPR